MCPKIPNCPKYKLAKIVQISLKNVYNLISDQRISIRSFFSILRVTMNFIEPKLQIWSNKQMETKIMDHQK